MKVTTKQINSRGSGATKITVSNDTTPKKATVPYDYSKSYLDNHLSVARSMGYPKTIVHTETLPKGFRFTFER